VVARLNNNAQMAWIGQIEQVQNTAAKNVRRW
jgi:hypothetical protein